MSTHPVGIRWTIGDVSDEGFEALRLSLWGARAVFGDAAALAVCVNTVPLEAARGRTGEVPEGVEWIDATALLPPWMDRHLDAAKAEGVGWKFAPPQLFPDRHELALDNDCILWSMPDAVRRWLDSPRGFCTAEDVARMPGQFSDLCGPEPRNSGIRGLPPGFDLRAALEELLAEHPVTLRSELDEQGMQVAMLQRRDAWVVRVDEVSICGPFPPHRQQPGRCGAHFVGLNARRLPWEHEGRNGSHYIRENFRRWHDVVAERVGAPAPVER